ncbi:splicing factor 3B subunit 3-like, partial [Trifolium medium]|nr:splicing factor 3B subunit 3-like [Trifolium medium]
MTKSAINGNFSGGKGQEIPVANGKCFDLLRPDLVWIAI